MIYATKSLVLAGLALSVALPAFAQDAPTDAASMTCATFLTLGSSEMADAVSDVRQYGTTDSAATGTGGITTGTDAASDSSGLGADGSTNVAIGDGQDTSNTAKATTDTGGTNNETAESDSTGTGTDDSSNVAIGDGAGSSNSVPTATDQAGTTTSDSPASDSTGTGTDSTGNVAIGDGADSSNSVATATNESVTNAELVSGVMAACAAQPEMSLSEVISAM